MIAARFYQGSGLGNQLHRYVAARVLARDKKCSFGMVNPELFKGRSFINLDMGDPLIGQFREWNERRTNDDNGVDIRGYDPEINFVESPTIIDGELQDSRYFEHRIDEVREWLRVEPLAIPDNVCVIGFRGGEYTIFPDLFLTKDYWDSAIEMINGQNPNIKFEVHTDDPRTAEQFFPKYDIIHDIGINWRSVRYAKYLIIANSSFYIFPALLNQDLRYPVIAPRYWARRNTKTWALPSNYYKQFMYI